MEGLLVKVRGNGRAFRTAATRSFGARALAIDPILDVPAQSGNTQLGIAPSGPSTWLRIELKSAASANSWDEAHNLLAPGQPFGAAGPQNIEAIEPDHAQEWPFFESRGHGAALAADEQAFCAFDEQDGSGGKARGAGVGWNFGNAFSEVTMARGHVGNKLERVLIAHLDTGFDPRHVTLPVRLRKDLQRNFVKGGNPNDASDQVPPGMQLMRNRGHGTGTLSLLAGNKLDGTSPNWPGYKDFLGGAPLAQVIPVRIADWVVRFTTGTMVQGIAYAREKGAHVLSMSMGGLSSQALVDAVNLAYDAGIFMVTAGGNNVAGLPTPKSIVFPARYRRVLAACGLMADGRAYAGLDLGTMQGNYGPPTKMETAIGAYTPNVPWAQIDCQKIVDMDGAGTSAATPQIAAAAALWLAEYWETVMQYPQPWMRVEAVRHALFTTAQKSTGAMGPEETREKIGQGILKAHAALQSKPLPAGELRRLPPAEASWSWLDLIFGGGVSLAPGPASAARRAMLALELTQMAQRVCAVDEAATDIDRSANQISPAARNRYLEAALDLGDPSKPLRALLERLLARQGPPAVMPASKKATVKRKVKAPPTPRRRLRVYALDPSVAKKLASAAVNETTLSVPWDDEPVAREPLRPGPVGEYLEVVDVDPASDRLYEPVDLNDKTLLAQDGWQPSEGNPQFHQQMVYAVAMTTIGHFEHALGRRALWAPRYAPQADGSLRAYEVPRLRLYPHALRTDNAYYSPAKKALLFGYFPSDSKHDDVTTPGSMVFTCLSSDIIAHEMSHALLDGLHRRFQEVSNPDVPAFHEAFADIVALFQHFTVTELVRHEIARARGDLTAATLLAGLAQQFGEGTSKRGPLRNYLDPEMKGLRYAETKGAHDRGSILVFAVYEAFLRIVARRTEGLIRLATGGTGVLPQGALHPDLVDRLTEETCKAAKHVLHICIRALDYCPSVDITFGEYLRALITADLDFMADDPHGYRIAFMEAFRERGILPRDIRTVSVETLAWNTLDDPQPSWLGKILKDIDLNWNRDLDRSQIFALNEKNRWRLWSGLKKVFADNPDVYNHFGLLPGVPRYDSNGEVFRNVGPSETTFDVFSVRPARRIVPDGSFRTEVVAVIHQRRPEPLDGANKAHGWFWFRGGATLIFDPREGKEHIRYSIIKNSSSETRLARQRQTAAGSFVSPLRALYFGGTPNNPSAVVSEPFALMHARDDDV